MSVRVAIPEPTANDQAYNEFSLPPYLEALRAAGTEPILIPLNTSQDRVARLLSDVQGIVLPGSHFDVDPQTYGEDPIPECAPPDPARIAVDELLLQEGFSLQKPILAICYGIQALNAWRNGTLFQDLPSQFGTAVNHDQGRAVDRAHPIQITDGSRLASLLPAGELHHSWVNSRHHQAIRVAGDNLLVTATSPDDGMIEAVELDSPEHFVLGVQWHPESTYAVSALSRAAFAAFAHEAESWTPHRIEESVDPG
jgi:putative glutamine amidotransferase